MTGAFRGVLGILLILAAVVVNWTLDGNLLATHREKALSQAWCEMLIPLESIPGRYPKVKANSSAHALEAMSAKLGVDLSALDAPNRALPSKAERKEMQGIEAHGEQFIQDYRTTAGFPDNCRLVFCYINKCNRSRCMV
jgi:hypothetical protein